jgi:hypothetical protein
MTDKFVGFELPKENWSKLPHTLIEALPQITSMAELKVILYILRHTWGFQEFGEDQFKKITLDEFQNGRKARNKETGKIYRMDHGTGLARANVIQGIRAAVAHGFIVKEQDDSDKARIENYYRLNMLNLRKKGYRIETPGVSNQYLGGIESIPRSEKDTSERNSSVDTLLPATLDEDDDSLLSIAGEEGSTQDSNSPDGESESSEDPHGLEIAKTPAGQQLLSVLQDLVYTGRKRAPQQFPNARVRDKFMDAANRLDGNLQAAMDAALTAENPVTSLSGMVNYLAKYEPNKFSNQDPSPVKIPSDLEDAIKAVLAGKQEPILDNGTLGVEVGSKFMPYDEFKTHLERYKRQVGEYMGPNGKVAVVR